MRVLYTRLCFFCFSDYGRVLWRKVFVKALPNRISLIKFLFGG